MTQPSGPDDRPTGAPSSPARSQVGAQVIDLGDLDWCWRRLHHATRGTLSSPGAQKPVGLDVAYVVTEGQIVISAVAGSGVLQRLSGTEVTLGLVGRSSDGTRWVVRATGVAQHSLVPARSATVTGCRGSHPARGVDLAQVDALVLPRYRLRGYRETPLDVSGASEPPDDRA